MLNDDFKIANISFPDQLASDSVKKTKEYGLSVGKAIESEWFRKDNGAARFYNNRDNFHKLRQYARGEQSVQKYKNELAINGDTSYLNLDWTPVPIVPKFVDVVVNGMSNRLFDIKVEAIDDVARSRRDNYKNTIEKDMLARESLEFLQQASGDNLFSTDQATLPDSDEELELHMELSYKQKIEVAEEKALQAILDVNDYELIKRQIDEDATVLGLSAVKHSFNTHDGIKIEYVDPTQMVHSPTEDPNFNDCYYFGEVKNVNITELKKLDPSLTQEEIKDISKLSAKWDAYQGIRGGYKTDNFDSNTATLLYFCYKTDKNIIYKVKENNNGGRRAIRKDENFNPPKTEAARFEKKSKRIDVWYEGVIVLGTNTVLKWDLMKNMVRPKSGIQKVLAPYVLSAPKMYRGQIDSLVKRMIPFADQIQLTHLKLQQVISKMIPDGVYLDLDGIASVDLGNGAMYNPNEALNMYFQTGSVVGRSFTEDGEFNNAKIPVQELTSSGSNAKISSLIGMYNHYIAMIRDVTGINEARDGSMPDSKTLVGVQKLAALNSNTATRHVLDSGLRLTKRLIDCVAYRFSDMLEYTDMRESLMNMIGSKSVAIIDDIKDIHLHDFGIEIELHPDEEERGMLEQSIQLALSKQMIDLNDAIDIRNIRNIKLSNALLKIRKDKKEILDLKKKEANIKMQTESNVKSSEAASANQIKEMQFKMQSELEMEKQKAMLEIQRMTKQAELDMMLQKQKLEMSMMSKQTELAQLSSREKNREDRKDQRVDQQSENQSKLIEQRKGNKPEQEFSNNTQGIVDQLLS
tara:strand:+ start:7678 stop:10092 length:2415 start_codon:yes stop_codon:yes gene_type:complete